MKEISETLGKVNAEKYLITLYFTRSEGKQVRLLEISFNPPHLMVKIDASSAQSVHSWSQ